MEASGEPYTQATVDQGKSFGTRSIGCCAGTRVGLDTLKKRTISCPYQKSNYGSSVNQLAA